MGSGLAFCYPAHPASTAHRRFHEPRQKARPDPATAMRSRLRSGRIALLRKLVVNVPGTVKNANYVDSVWHGHEEHYVATERHAP